MSSETWRVRRHNGRRWPAFAAAYEEAAASCVALPFSLPEARATTRSAEATTLFHELRKPLLRYLVCLGLTTDDAQDVVQDAFLSLHQHLESGGAEENIRGWLFRVAHNQARNRQKTYERRFAERLEPGIERISNASTPEQVVLKKEKFRRLEKAIRLLSECERECLLLRAEGLRYREIADVLGIATSTVGEAVDRAVRKLAEKCNV
jgi:RNA polymerase sigma-70 factor (ECF subfamily)